MRKKKRLRIDRLVILCTFCLAILGLIGFGAWQVYAWLALPLEPSANEQIPKADVTAQPVQNDHSKQVEAIQKRNALEKVNVTGFSESEIRQLFFSAPLSQTLIERMNGLTFDGNQDFVTFDDLRYVKVLYKDYQNQDRVGELVVHKDIASDVENIFHQLYMARYQIEKMILPDAYGGDNQLSMADNNTSALNFRLLEQDGVVEHEHALGLAIDLNPVYNPRILSNGETQWVEPADGIPYQDRSILQPHMIYDQDPAVSIFASYGFFWVGHSANPDYMHFEKWDHVKRGTMVYTQDELDAIVAEQAYQQAQWELEQQQEEVWY